MLDSPQVGAVPIVAVPAAAWPAAATRALVPLFAATLFLSSFLMFTVEPMVARQMLPVLGGVPMVWNGCVVFFQAVLLVGYGSAHVLTRRIASPVRLLVYAGISTLPLLFVRLGVDTTRAAGAAEAPLSWLLGALLASVGPLFLVLAISASVLQSTFASTRHESARDPYFLYAASNAGSLVALMAYPTVIEPLLGLSRQARVWTIGYGFFVLCVLACAVAARFALRSGAVAVPHAAEVPADGEALTWTRRARWCVLAAVPSSLMLGVTSALTTDIAPVPLLWVAPLALYLLTFILAFGRGRDRALGLADRFLPPLLLAVAVALMLRAQLKIAPALLVHLMPFLAAATLCHALVAKDRPSSRHLTEFYFWLALGGMVGGLFNTLAAPLLFSRIVEYPLALAAVACLRPSRSQKESGGAALDWILPLAAAGVAGAVLFGQVAGTQSIVVASAMVLVVLITLGRRHDRWTLAAVAGIFLVASPWVKKPGEQVLHAERTFFGAYRVSEDPASRTRSLAHGTTLHGMQYVQADRRGEPLTYYHRNGPLGRLLATVPQLKQPGEVAAIGLGIGTLAAYVRPGQHWTFFEIDPAIERIARDDRFFTFLKDCDSRCRVVIGDARLSLTERKDARYQLIVLDAFSSDAIPMHLLTQEAVALYLSRLEPHGVMAFHVSNRHLDLGPVVGRLAADSGLIALPLRDQRGPAWPSERAPSAWVMVARTADDLRALTGNRTWSPPPVGDAPRWTDDFSNILQVLNLGLR